MHAKALEIAWHDDSPIWSVDISCDNRVVTASGDKVARLWRFHPNPHSALASFVSKPGDANSPSEGSGHQEPIPGRSPKTSSNLTPSRLSSKFSKITSIKLDATLVEWLCDLRAHATTINIARFSPDGLCVATAADHGEIVIWRLSLSPVEVSPLFAVAHDDDAPKERWQIDVTLRGHLQDVLDLAWSYDSSKLVSASVDNTVMIWDLRNPSKTPFTLRKHSNFVQGIAIDPLSRLVASMGNDRSLRIFTSNSTTWCQVTSVNSLGPDSRLFLDDSQFNNFFRRLSWSPDGSVLACPSGIHLPKEPKRRLFAVHIFARNQWAAPVIQCGGLLTPACAVRFSPVLYHLRNPSEPTPPPTSPTNVASKSPQAPFRLFTYRMIFAVACAHIILFYDTEHLMRPFATVEGLHCAEHTDIAWSADGRTLLVSAVDGYISVISFSEEELGQPLSQSEMPPWLNRDEEVLIKSSSEQKGQKVAFTVVQASVVRPKQTGPPVASQSIAPEADAATITPLPAVPLSGNATMVTEISTPCRQGFLTISNPSTVLNKQDSPSRPAVVREAEKASAGPAQPATQTADHNFVSTTEASVYPNALNLKSQQEPNSADLVKPVAPKGSAGESIPRSVHHSALATNRRPEEDTESLAGVAVLPSSANLQVSNSTHAKLTAVEVMDVDSQTSPSEAEEVVFVREKIKTKLSRLESPEGSIVEPSPAKRQKVTPRNASKRHGKSKVQTKFCFLPTANNTTAVVGLAVTPEVTTKQSSYSNSSSQEEALNTTKVDDSRCQSLSLSADVDVEMTPRTLP